MLVKSNLLITNSIHLPATNLNESNIIEYLIDETYFPTLLQTKFENEKNHRMIYEGFTDLDMIYYFVHQRKDIQKSKQRKESTKMEYIRELLQFYRYLLRSEEFLRQDVASYIETSLFKNLKQRHIDSYQQWLSTYQYGPNKQLYRVTTLSRKLVILKSFFKFLFDSHYVQVPLYTRILNAKITKDDLPNRDLEESEVKALLNFYNGNILKTTIIKLLATTGMRIRELAEANWGKVTKDSNAYWLEIVGKGNKKREVKLLNHVFVDLCKLRSRRGLSNQIAKTDSSPFFPNKLKQHYSFKYLSKYVIEMIKDSELTFVKDHNRTNNISPHFFRHHYACRSIEKGASIYQVSRSLGHESIQTTEIYLAKMMNRTQNASNVWDDEEY
ncbi:tyrosine-type recombinase/integrase [Gottfriedia sp. NPDC058432]|uniref:tyrosine-type recombinase/integrase n=1 Tax=Gottfriedia sp. NPDC058432 TaxID=3346497 RepID=UPI00364FD06D